VAAVTRYTVDGVAMARYLVDRLPPAADEIANHRVRGTEAIVTNDEEFATEETVWR